MVREGNELMRTIPFRDYWSAARWALFLWRHGLRSADGIATHLTNEEKRELFLLVIRLQPTIVAEIGSYLGCSSSFLAAGLSKVGSGAKLYCIDTWKNETMPEGERDTFDEFSENTRNYKEIIQPIRLRSTDAALEFTDKIDLLFIDADHSYTAVKADWSQWLPHLNPNACVVMHDVGWAEGVQRVVNEDIRPLSVTEKSMPNLYWATLATSKHKSKQELH